MLTGASDCWWCADKCTSYRGACKAVCWVLLRHLLLVCIALVPGLVLVLPRCQLLDNRGIIGSVLLVVVRELHDVHRCISLVCRGVRCWWLLAQEQLLL
jgi:hypothetical protein